MFQIRRIKEETMAPAYTPGMIVAVYRKAVCIGDAVLIRVDGNEVVRRVIGSKEGSLTLASDHLPKEKVTAKVEDVIGVIVFSFPMATPAGKPRKPYARVLASVTAAILMGMAAMQLISFDLFIPILDSYRLPIEGAVIAAILVTLNVAALPFLLHMAVSPLARMFSMAAGWMIAICWLFLGFYAYYTPDFLISTGHLGGVIDTSPGLWAIAFGVGLCLLVILSNWSLGFSFKRRR